METFDVNYDPFVVMDDRKINPKPQEIDPLRDKQWGITASGIIYFYHLASFHKYIYRRPLQFDLPLP